MTHTGIYDDMAKRTGGEIYIGVVGPVRTGKSTFIRNFMELMVLPAMQESHEKQVARDELPQACAGRTIMTTEPKFIPKEAATLVLDAGTRVRVRLIDCVGFLTEGAAGHEENGEERMVRTPWFDEEIPFSRAAEIGTRKVINEHSTIGILVTTDGSFGELRRESYVSAEEKTVRELKKIGKPFVIVLNCARPHAEETGRLAASLEASYGVKVLPVSCEQLKAEDAMKILEAALMEFPVTRIDFHIPRWMEILPAEHPLKQRAVESLRDILARTRQMKDVKLRARGPADKEEALPEGFCAMSPESVDLSTGCVHYRVEVEEACYYEAISRYAGIEISGEYQLMKTIRDLAGQKNEYARVRLALEQVRRAGYGIVVPERSEIHLEEPELFKQNGRYGVRMRAQAPSIHLIRTLIDDEIAPIIGDEAQAVDLINYIRHSGETETGGIWETNIFGKSIGQIVDESIRLKTSQMSDDVQIKLQRALQKIVSAGSGGLLCIVI